MMFSLIKSKKLWSVLALACILSVTILNRPVRAGGDGPFPLAIVTASNWVSEAADANFYVRVEPVIILPNGDTSVLIEVIDIKTNKVLSFGTGTLKKDASSLKAKLTDYEHRSQLARINMNFNAASESYLMHLSFSGNAVEKPKTIVLRQKPF
jgi:hypothetical protein